MHDCIIVNGDSYSAKTHHKVYSDFVESDTNIPVINLAVAGSNNQRIARSTIEKLIEVKEKYKNPLVIVAWSFIRRIEVWYYGHNPGVISKIPDRVDAPDHLQSRLITLDMLVNLGHATLEQKCLVNEDLFVHKHLIDFYTMLYSFAHTIQSLGADLFCFSAAKNTDIPVHSFPYIESLRQVQWCQQQPNIHKLHDFCIKDWAELNDPHRNAVTGHLGEDGHRKFANEILFWLRSSKIV